MDASSNKAPAAAMSGPPSVRRGSGLAAEVNHPNETESVGSRFSNRYDEDLEMGSPGRGYRARGAGGRNSRRVSRSANVGGGASVASRSHYYGESDEEDSYMDEEVCWGLGAWVYAAAVHPSNL